ncbi:MAG: hypothetical protein WD335_01305 [Candidatus Paceibacterota bacterium]
MANILIVEGDSRQVKSAIDHLGEKNELVILNCDYTGFVSLELFDFILIDLLKTRLPDPDYYRFGRERMIFKEAFNLLDRLVIRGIAFVGNPCNPEEKFNKDVLSLFARSYKFCFPNPPRYEHFRAISSRGEKSELRNSLVMFNHMIDEYKYLLTPEGNRLRTASLSLDQISDLCYNKDHVPEIPWKEVVHALELPK